jgi:hypothetical protein
MHLYFERRNGILERYPLRPGLGDPPGSRMEGSWLASHVVRRTRLTEVGVKRRRRRVDRKRPRCLLLEEDEGR